MVKKKAKPKAKKVGSQKKAKPRRAAPMPRFGPDINLPREIGSF